LQFPPLLYWVLQTCSAVVCFVGKAEAVHINFNFTMR